MASAAFTKALLRKNNAKELAKTVREAKNGAFTLAHIDDGKYIVRVKGECGITPNKDIPFVSFSWAVEANEDGTDSEFKGKGSQKTFYLESDDEEREMKEWSNLGKTLKVLSSRPDIDNFDMQDLEAIVEEINKEAPYVRSQLKKWQKTSVAPDGTITVTKEGYNIFFNEKVEVVEDTNEG